MRKKYAALTATMTLLFFGGYLGLMRTAYTQPQPGRPNPEKGRAFTLAFDGDEVTVRLEERIGAAGIKMNRLTRANRSARSDMFDRLAVAKTASSDARNHRFRLNAALADSKIMPIEITVEEEEAEPTVVIAYVRSAGGKLIETNWSEYACSEKIYLCGKDSNGRLAMRLPAKKEV